MNFSGKINSKLPSAGTTIFAVMSRLAAETGAINLSQGFPDFDVPPDLFDLVDHHMRKGHNQYAPMQGLMSLREKLSEKYLTLNDRSYDPETEITITAGATQAIFTAIAAIVRNGDEVIIPEPAYDCYAPAVIIAGGKPVYLELDENTFRPDWQKVQASINDRTRMIVITSPHNPCGSTLLRSDIDALEKLTKDTDIIILSDEVYEHIIFDGRKHQSVSQSMALAEKSFIVYSFGKTYHATGWKLGYCLAPENLMTEFRRIHQFLVFSVNTPMQYALSDYIDNKSYLGLAEFYQRKRDYFLKLIAGSRFTYTPAEGSYFQSLCFKNFSTENDFEFAVRLTKECGIASIPLSSFYHDKKDLSMLRFCFAKKDETLERAAEKICSAR